ncbi:MULTISPECIES: cation:proton antiporter regulatory subunit [Deinococcus]|jgi:potassium/proton antiporter regulatory subunit, CPA2 family (TC 2.A.37.5.2)|uniref:cation:proton antiporter regulatory subunit n=1 Tax=Deinococcus radiodurans TaxID=1299 RepID=UPI0004897B65|nr:cation:proton antiporter regulatory subunit [Deinococcus radiodurans]ANC71678.1 potassium transporter TrkA [Deinococcus radiodurans R1 = ATCC 13939 = DSM 20539]QIP29231.1 cation:proton antiporter regulatory subunit [Deinococcus radiodurans]QIP32076.1 cation:proton antiporter regulatory subunit [Deinococcus radiodurans]UID70142.1 potassium transporter TrkA [Deinococcus radiodurans R1 = ATCC 13939 = DSM 20539]UTA50658.1 cation:proton antiporter regulatory subunit [Deinococcus radiodurans]
MVRLEETSLPGVGMRYDFDGRFGKRVGVIVHRDGRREMFVSLRDDPDACGQSITLDEGEAEVVADLLGGSTVTRRMGQTMQDIEGLAMDWLPLERGSPFAGRALGDSQMRTRTGTSVVAVIRNEQAIPAPGPDYVLEAGDTVVVVGTANGVRRAARLLSSGADS